MESLNFTNKYSLKVIVTQSELIFTLCFQVSVPCHIMNFLPVGGAGNDGLRTTQEQGGKKDSKRQFSEVIT